MEVGRPWGMPARHSSHERMAAWIGLVPEEKGGFGADFKCKLRGFSGGLNGRTRGGEE